MTDTTSEPKLIASTVTALPASAAQRFSDRIAARFKVQDEWRDMSYAELGTAIEEIALGLAAMGIEPGDRVCILSDTRLEWTLASYGISAAGAVVVPIYPTNSANECKWVIGNSGARVVVVENEGQADKIAKIRDELPKLEHVIGIDSGGDSSVEELRER
jgi:long-chain acyl-CoA synthetase